MKKLVCLVALLLSTLLFAACGDDSGDDGGAVSSDASGEASFNDADVTFAQRMIPHHQQAVEMAQIAQERAESAGLQQLASEIEAAQAPEIEQLTTWLEDWDTEVPSGSMDDGDMGGGMGDDSPGGMSGMMSAEDMSMLGAANGEDFDQMFLTMMIEHHEGAVEMAETEVADGESTDAIAMAEQIISTQEAEIAQMESMLDS